jgi:NADPH-dependent curcumin reductase CurA
MTTTTSRQWRLRARPVGMVKESDFELVAAPVPEPGEGEVLVRNLYLAFEPAMRGWMEDRPSYIPPVGIGEVMRGMTVGRVVASKQPGLAPGDLVSAMGGWQEWFASGVGVNKLPPGSDPTLALSALGLTGLTAYFGMLELGKPSAGETVVVSGAAGATGSVAGQLAKLHGCRVIGIAGGPAKCEWLTSEAHFDAAIDYTSEGVASRLAALAPSGIDVYFDNVGGPILEAVLGQIALRARIVLCGGISGYNDAEPQPGPRNLMNLVVRRGRMEGFIVIDHAARFPEATQQLSKWIAEGRIANRVDVQKGFENAPRTFQRLFRGENFGKQLLDLSS